MWMINVFNWKTKGVQFANVFYIFIEFQLCVDKCESCDVGVELTNTNLLLFESKK
jgi:hypothetical protein